MTSTATETELLVGFTHPKSKNANGKEILDLSFQKGTLTLFKGMEYIQDLRGFDDFVPGPPRPISRRFFEVLAAPLPPLSSSVVEADEKVYETYCRKKPYIYFFEPRSFKIRPDDLALVSDSLEGITIAKGRHGEMDLPSLQSCTQLTTFEKLSPTDGPDVRNTFTYGLPKMPPSLTNLSLSCCEDSEAHPIRLKTSLARVDRLVELKLHCLDLRQLLYGMRCFRTLQRLELLGVSCKQPSNSVVSKSFWESCESLKSIIITGRGRDGFSDRVPPVTTFPVEIRKDTHLPRSLVSLVIRDMPLDLPDTLSGCSNLQNLEATRCGLTSVPWGLSKLRKLAIIRLTCNNLQPEGVMPLIDCTCKSMSLAGNDALARAGLSLNANIKAQLAGNWKKPPRTSAAAPKQATSRKMVAECVVCLENEVSRLFQPCGHLCVCEGCCSNLETCPICRAKIKGTCKVFMPCIHAMP
jgi:hypothetical protein